MRGAAPSTRRCEVRSGIDWLSLLLTQQVSHNSDCYRQREGRGKPRCDQPILHSVHGVHRFTFARPQCNRPRCVSKRRPSHEVRRGTIQVIGIGIVGHSTHYPDPSGRGLFVEGGMVSCFEHVGRVG